MKAATAAAAIWSYISISSLRYACEMLRLGYNACTWRLLKYCRHESMWQITSPSGIWPFFRMRRDHRRFVILYFRLEWEWIRRMLLVVNHSFDCFIATHLHIEEDVAKCNCTAVTIPSHLMLHKVTVGNCSAQQHASSCIFPCQCPLYPHSVCGGQTSL